MRDKLEIRPVYFIYGSEDYLAEELFRRIREQVLTPGLEAMNYQLFHRDSMDARDVLVAAGTLPAFADKRLVVVRGAESLRKADEEAFAGYVADPAPSTCLVFLSDSEKVDRRSAFIKLLEKHGYLNECRGLRERELYDWVRREAAELGKKLDGAAARRLVETAGTRLRVLKGELEKVALFCGEKEAIEAADVEEAGLDLREETAFKLSDAIGARNVRAALKVYEKLKDEEPLKVLGAIARQVRILLKVKSLSGSGLPAQAMARRIGVQPWTMEGYSRAAARFTEEELKASMGRVARADKDLKSSPVPKGLVMSRLIIELAGRG